MTSSRSPKRPFGLLLSTDSAADLAAAALSQRRSIPDGVGLVVTPNIDHIATIRRSPEMARAYANAARIVCDGWPVQMYARICGLRLDRVTGCEITAKLMRTTQYPAWHRWFFVVDSAATAAAVQAWAHRTGFADRCVVTVPPFGFDKDVPFCENLAERIAQHETTVLLMAVGAPRSEIFIDTHRATLPPCWAFCVGQAVKVELGLVRRAPPRWQSAGVEWLWRMLQEPSRLTTRYVTASIGFGMAILQDRFRQ